MKSCIKFLPLLILYSAIVLVASKKQLVHDEIRYAMFAENITQGYYSPPDELRLVTGPGLPLILVPFKVLGLPWAYAKLINALFLFCAVVCFFAALKELGLDDASSTKLTYLFGVFPPFMRWLPLFMTETVAIFLVCGFMLCYCRALRYDKGFQPGATVLAALLLGFLALTKVLFGYVIVTFFVLCAGCSIITRDRRYIRPAIIAALALAICSPYLVYTYRLTSKPFYWATTGGAQLYWMTSPYEGELGDWFPFTYDSLKDTENSQLLEHHGEFFQANADLNQVEWDDKLKQRAWQQIKDRPDRYVENWFANVGRLLFGYPFSYTSQKLSTYFFLLPNSFIFVLAVLCLYPTWVGRNLIPLRIGTLLAFALIAIAGSSLVSAYARFFIPLIPIVALWICFMFTQVVTIQIRTTVASEHLPA